MNYYELKNSIKDLDLKISNVENQQKKLEDEKKDLLNQKQTYLDVINECRTFNIDVFGRVVARLLSSIEGEEYVYYCAYKHVEIPEYDMFSDYVGKREYDKPIKLLIPKRFKKDVIYEDDYLRSIPSFKVMDSNSDYNATDRDLRKTIQLDDDFRFTLSTYDYHNNPLSGYYTDSIKEFFDIVIEYRLGKNDYSITEEEINTLLDKYLDQYDFELVSYIKKVKKR